MSVDNFKPTLWEGALDCKLPFRVNRGCAGNSAVRD